MDRRRAICRDLGNCSHFNRDFHQLLREVGELNGRQMVLNTSFSVKGEPIVNTPRQAIETFLGTGIDALYLGDVLVTRA